MSDRRDLRNLRRAGKLAKRQQHQLAKLELAGFTAVTLHVHGQQLTITLERSVGVALADMLREALRERRQAFEAEAQQVHRAWLEGEWLDGRLTLPGLPPLP